MKLLALLRKSLFVVLCTILLTACTKLTQENFDKIQPGMTMEQVVAILGEPTMTKSVSIAGISGTSAVWRDKDTEIDIQFFNNTVQVKSLNSVSS